MLLFPPASFVSENRTRIFSRCGGILPRHPRGRLFILKPPRCSSRSQKVSEFEAFFTRATNPLAHGWVRLDLSRHHERLFLCPFADSHVAGVPHCLCGLGHRDAVVDGGCGGNVSPHAATSLSRS